MLHLKHSTLDVLLYFIFIKHDYSEPYASAKSALRNTSMDIRLFETTGIQIKVNYQNIPHNVRLHMTM